MKTNRYNKKKNETLTNKLYDLFTKVNADGITKKKLKQIKELLEIERELTLRDFEIGGI